MSKQLIPKGNYFLIGVGIGSLMAILFAPKSGEETRKYLGTKARAGNDLSRKKARDLQARVEEAVDRGKGIVGQTKGQIAAAIDVGVEAYNLEKSAARVS